MKKINICIAGLGTVGSSVVDSLSKNYNLNKNKTKVDFNIIGISAKNKNKKRIFEVKNFNWYDNPLDLIDLPNCDVLIELIGEEKGLSYELIKKSLQKKIHVITANKALLSIHGNKLFAIADENNVSLMFEAAVAGGIPIIKTLKQSIYLNKIKRISGIFNGTTNYILTEMEKKNLSFNEILKQSQNNGYAESDPTNDIDGIDAAHKLSLLSSLCFSSRINFNNITFQGIRNIEIDDIINAERLGYKIKLLAESEIINNKIMAVVEPKLIRKSNHLANIDGVLNAVKIETDHLNPLILEGEGAGGKATASSIISDLYDVSLRTNVSSLGLPINSLKDYDSLDLSNSQSSYYLRILVKDISGVLATITSNLNDEGISIETILQTPDDKNTNDNIPIIIITHFTNKKLLMNAVTRIQKLDFVSEEITIIKIDKDFD